MTLDLVLTHPPARNPRAAEIEDASAALARSLGLLHDDNAARFAAFNSLGAYVYPTAAPERAIACAAWCNWLFFFDDIHDEQPQACADPTEVARTMRRYLGVLREGGDPRDADPLVRLLVDFRARALALCAPGWLGRFSASVEDYFFLGTLPAVEHFLRGEPPSLARYLEQREHDSAVHTALDLIELAEDIHLPPATLCSPVTRRARRACARTIAYCNDLVSYPKEVLQHRNPNNLLPVLQREHACTLAEAQAEATRIVNDYAGELLALKDEFLAQDERAHGELSRYFTGLRQWQRGNIDSSLEGRRYRAPGALFEALRD